MCGLAGIIDPRLSRESGDLLLTKMLASIRHRGPDNSSRWIDMPVLLGHNRLSIIDLGAEANQPMVSGDHVLVYNGELYNYVELRDELTKLGHSFRTRSDTEVLLVAYREWGDRCVSRFVGMWAFAIWNTRKQELFCSRDRFGIKPFYYIHEGDRFYFGSEYKPSSTLPCSPVGSISSRSGADCCLSCRLTGRKATSSVSRFSRNGAIWSSEMAASRYRNIGMSISPAGSTAPCKRSGSGSVTSSVTASGCTCGATSGWEEA